METLVGGVLRVRWWLLAVAVLIGAVAYRPAGQVRFDRAIENMFAPHDPLLVPYRRLKQLFGGNEIVLVVYEDPQLFAVDGEGIERVRRLSDQLRAVAGVQEVLSLAELDKSLRQVGSGRIFDAHDPLAAQYRELFAGYTHSHDRRIAAVVCMLTPEQTAETTRRETIDALRRCTANLPASLQPVQLVGEPVMVVDGFRYVEADGERLGWATTILLAITIVGCFRSLRWVLIPVAVVQLTLLATRAVLVWSQLRLSMVSSMLTAIVTVVGVATVVHIIVRFRDARRQGRPAEDALRHTLTLLAAPIFWACATDAVGFGSLIWSHVGPVHDFGIMMAIGSSLVLLSVVLLVPALALWGTFDQDPQRVWGERRLDRLLYALVEFTRRRPYMLGGVLLGVCGWLAAGACWLEVETDFTRNFRADSPIVQSYRFVETRLGGAGVWDILVPTERQLTPETLQRIRALEEQLRQIPTADRNGSGQDAAALSKVISLADALQATESHPLLAQLPLAMRTQGMSAVMPGFMAALHSQQPDEHGRHYLRIMLRAPERQSATEKLALIGRVRELAATEFPARAADSPGAEVTGFFVLLSHLIASLISDQWVCFSIATAGIAVMMAVAFRNVRLALIALVPNAMPILIVLGTMGWLGTKMNMGAAMIAAVSMGLSVDSSIHYVTSFQRARRAGRSVFDSVQEVQQTVGRAAVFSTMALVVGFAVLCTSEFIPTIYFGVLVSLAMLGGLLGNLVVLPLLLLCWRSDST